MQIFSWRSGAFSVQETLPLSRFFARTTPSTTTLVEKPLFHNRDPKIPSSPSKMDWNSTDDVEFDYVDFDDIDPQIRLSGNAPNRVVSGSRSVQSSIPQIQIGGMPSQQQLHPGGQQRQFSGGSTTSHSSLPSDRVSCGSQFQSTIPQAMGFPPSGYQQQQGDNMTNSYLQVVGNQRHVSGSSATSHSSTSSVSVGSGSQFHSVQPSPVSQPSTQQQQYRTQYSQALDGQQSVISNNGYGYGFSQPFSSTRQGQPRPPPLQGPFNGPPPQQNQQPTSTAASQFLPPQTPATDVKFWAAEYSGQISSAMPQNSTPLQEQQPLNHPPVLHSASNSPYQQLYLSAQQQSAYQHNQQWTPFFADILQVDQPQSTMSLGPSSSACQQFTPSAPHFQPGAQQHYTGGMMSSGGSQFGNGAQQGHDQQLSATTIDFQPGMQQHVMDWEAGEASASSSRPVHHQGEYRPEHYNTGATVNPQVNGGQSVEDHRWRSLLDEVEEWRNETKAPMTEVQKAQFAAYAAWREKERKGTKRLADLGTADFDDDDMEEAVHANKRRRVDDPESRQFYDDAQMVYAFGPPNNPELPAVDPHQEELDGLALDEEILQLSPHFKMPINGKICHLLETPDHRGPSHKASDPDFRLIETICSNFWLMIEITKHLPVKDLVMLYSISKTFRDAVNARFMSTMTAWAEHKSFSGWEVFYWKFYGKYCMDDPLGKPWNYSGPVEIPRPPWAVRRRVVSEQSGIRKVPGFKYLAMLDEREIRTRDILACLARAGHRMPASMHITLKKIWMIMDMATNQLRRAFMHNKKLWTAVDLYNAQFFVMKLHMRFNEPIFGPCSLALGQTFLGARKGLTPLWKLLRRKAYNTPREVIQQRVRYFVPQDVADHYTILGEPYFDVHPVDIGMEHKEGWGSGKLHLLRPDELIVEECVRRRIDMKRHLVFMAFWGHVDWKGRRNLVPTEEEMYMSDDEMPKQPKEGKYSRYGLVGRCGNVPFEYENWQPKHAMKARWDTLTNKEKEMLQRDDAQEHLRSLPFEDDDNAFWDPYNVNDDMEGNDEPFDEGDEDDEMDVDDDAESNDSDLRPVEIPDIIEQNTITYPIFPDAGSEQQPDVEYVADWDPPIPPIPSAVWDPEIRANWSQMDPFLRQIVIDGETRLAEQDIRDERTVAAIVRDEEALRQRLLTESLGRVRAQFESAQVTGQMESIDNDAAGSSIQQQGAEPGSALAGYEYPGVTDSILLELLKKYDQFSPQDFECVEDGDSGGESDDEEDDGYNEGNDDSAHEQLDSVADMGGHQSDHDSDGGDEDSDEGSAYTDPLVNVDPEDMDDEDLKALADLEYSDGDLDFDLTKYKKFLDRAVGDGSKKNTPEEEEEDDTDGELVGNEDGDDDEMVHEADMDGESALPKKYDFRKY